MVNEPDRERADKATGGGTERRRHRVHPRRQLPGQRWPRCPAAGRPAMTPAGFTSWRRFRAVSPSRTRRRPSASTRRPSNCTKPARAATMAGRWTSRGRSAAPASAGPGAGEAPATALSSPPRRCAANWRRRRSWRPPRHLHPRQLRLPRGDAHRQRIDDGG